jgi:vacuolar-type H+-ATPase catalytic subunit A/Vma1
VISDFPEKFLEQRAKQTIDDIESYEILSEIIDSFIKSGEIKELFNSMDRFAYLRDIKDRIGKLKTE